MGVKQIMYFGYYLKNLDRPIFNKFLDHAKSKEKGSTIGFWKNIIAASLRYNISILEYFQFRFSEKTEKEKAAFAGTGYMYEYQKEMNPSQFRSVLEDKIQFLDKYKEFVLHGHVTLTDLEANNAKAKAFLLEANGKDLVLKNSYGQCGRGISFIKSNTLDRSGLIKKLVAEGNDFIETFVKQHPKLNELSPSGLNTVRVVSQINKEGAVDLLAGRLRITVNNTVDNLAAGNLAASIALDSGKVNHEAVYSDITKPNQKVHPVTGVSIIGFEIPYWEETKNMIIKAAMVAPENKSVGWDVAITEHGPELIEGNHDWCKLLWQLPVEKGLKNELEAYRKKIK